MLQPIQKDHELVCQNCGCVLGEISDSQQNDNSIIPLSVDMLLLGSAFDKNVKCSFPRTRQQSQEEQVLKLLISITKSYALPESLAVDTYTVLKKKNRGFWSQTEPIKQLIKILSKDDNYYYIHKLRAIKEKYKHLGI